MTEETKDKTCPYCAGLEGLALASDAERECDSEWKYLSCTRLKGHDGEHVACGLVFHEVARWPNDSVK